MALITTGNGFIRNLEKFGALGVYVPSTRPRIQRLMSEFAMVYILLPGSMLGFLVRNFMYIADLPPHPLLKNVELSS